MPMIGKKQRDIRNDNKSVIIDSLLRSQLTLADLEQQLKLSHTALGKVMNELLQLNVVRSIGVKAGDMGRPSALYDINPDCGVAAAVCFGVKRLEIFIVDMKGLQINKFVSTDEFSCADEALSFTENTIKTLLKHYRTDGADLSTICVSLPRKGLGASSFEECENSFKNGFSEFFRNTEIIVKSNNDFWAIGESKYGALHHFKNKGALLCEMEGDVGCSLFFNRVNYSGNKIEKGSINSLLGTDVIGMLQSVCGKTWEEIATGYRSGDKQTIKSVNDALSPLFGRVAESAFLLGVSVVIIGGALSSLGSEFLNAVNRALSARFAAKAVFSEIEGRSPSCSGAVWCASYTSLKKLL